MSHNNPHLDKIVEILENAKAKDLIVLDVKKQTSVTDYMIICSGTSSRHVKSIAEQLIVSMKSSDLIPLHHSGLEAGDWALVDFGDFVVHIMQPDCRQFYNLEELWQKN